MATVSFGSFICSPIQLELPRASAGDWSFSPADSACWRLSTSPFPWPCSTPAHNSAREHLLCGVSLSPFPFPFRFRTVGCPSILLCLWFDVCSVVFGDAAGLCSFQVVEDLSETYQFVVAEIPFAQFSETVVYFASGCIRSCVIASYFPRHPRHTSSPAISTTATFAMAPARARNAPPKKHTLTLAQIASYDDILTDALVDHVSIFLGLLPWPRVFRPSACPRRNMSFSSLDSPLTLCLFARCRPSTGRTSLRTDRHICPLVESRKRRSPPSSRTIWSWSQISRWQKTSSWLPMGSESSTVR